MRTDAGDTIAVEQVLSAPTWLDVRLTLPRRNEQQRVFLSRRTQGNVESTNAPPPLRWDITRGRDHVRVFAHDDSLYVTNGDMIGVPVSMRSLAAPAGTRPWHDASAALLEELVRTWRESNESDMPVARPGSSARMPVIALPWSDVVRTVTISALGADSVLARTWAGEWRLAVDTAGQLLGGSSPGRRLRIERIAWHPDSVVSSVTARPDSAIAFVDVPYVVQEVTLIAHDGVTLAGTFTHPSRTESVVARRTASTAHTTPTAPAVLLISGAGPQNRDLSVPALPNYRLFAALADTLTRRGYAVLRLDDRGTGASGGVAYSASPAEEVLDVRAAIAWLRARPDVQNDRIALVGHSDGGFTALDAAEAESVQALVLLGAPARSGRELARAQRRLYVTDGAEKFSSIEHERLLAQLERDAERVARVDAWMRAWLAHDPSERTWTHSAPVLLVHGERDKQVEPMHASELSRLLRGKSSRNVVVHMEPDANHLLVADTLGDPRRYAALQSFAPVRRVLGVITAWLDTHLADALDASQGAPAGAQRAR